MARLAERRRRHWAMAVRGIDREWIVAQWLRARGDQLIAWRARVLGIEVDWLVRSPKGALKLVEVKTLSAPTWSEGRIGSSQVQRLRRAACGLAKQTGLRVEIWGVFVHSDLHCEQFEIG